MNKLKEIAYILGLGAVCGYYGLTCFTYILAFLTHSKTVILHLNIYGELNIEFIITIISLPFAFYAIKDSIRLKKADIKSRNL